MGHEVLGYSGIPYVRFPENPQKIKIGDFEVFKYIDEPDIDKYIKALSDRNNLRNYDAILLNLWGSWELYKDLSRLQKFSKWPYMCEYHRTDSGVREDHPVDPHLLNKKVLLVEDIQDRGYTIQAILKKLGKGSRAAVVTTKFGVPGQILDDRVDSAVLLDDKWFGGKGMNMGFPGEKLIFRQYRGIVVKIG